MGNSAGPKGHYFYALGCDPGFARFGWTVCKVFADGTVWPVKIGLIETSLEKGKVKVIDDMLRRAREVGRALRDATFNDDGVELRVVDQVRIVCCEALSYPTNKSSVAKVCVAWGVLVMASLDVPMEQARPQEIKQAVAGAQSASKAEVEWALVAPAGRFKMTHLQGMLEAEGVTAKDKREHPVDAIGAVIASRDREMMLLLRRGLQG